MPNKQKVIENLERSTQRISDRVWTVAVGVLVFSLTFILEHVVKMPTEPRFIAIAWLIAAMILAIACLIFDLLQYIAGYYMNLRLLDKLDKSGELQGKFDNNSFAYRSRHAAFLLKIATCCAAAVMLTVVLGVRIVREI